MNSQLKLHPYKFDFVSSLPLGFRIYFFKFWIVGISYFFIGFGAMFNPGSYEQMISLGTLIGALNALVVSYVIRNMSLFKDGQNPYLSIQRKGLIGAFCNILLSIIFVILIGFSYDGINRFIIFSYSLDANRIYFPADPLGFSLMFLGFDFLWRLMTFRTKRNNKM